MIQNDYILIERFSSWRCILILTLDEIRKARNNLKGIIDCTPLKYSNNLSDLFQNSIFLKLECFQKTGSFKFRGAYNKLNINKEFFNNGAITASAGNHAQGVALAAKKLGLNSIVVMPENAPLSKVEATKKYGSKIVLEGKSYDDAFIKAMEICNQGKKFIPAFDDFEVMAGQGTIALEILNEVKDPDVIMVPVGGGGLISGIATGIKELSPRVNIIGIQNERTSSIGDRCEGKDDLANNFNDNAQSIADGIMVKNPGEKTIPVMNKYVDELVTVTEEEIAQAILLLLERSKIVVEGAGAVGLAALLRPLVELKGKKIVIILSGGNIDVNMIARIIQRGLARTGRIAKINTIIRDQPGELKGILELVSKTGANILSVHHTREDSSLPLGMVGVDLDLETRDRAHIKKLIEYLDEQGYNVLEK